VARICAPRHELYTPRVKPRSMLPVLSGLVPIILSSLADYSAPLTDRRDLFLTYDSLRSLAKEFYGPADALCHRQPGATYFHDMNDADLRRLSNGPTIKKIGQELRALEPNQCRGAFIETSQFNRRRRNEATIKREAGNSTFDYALQDG
jgi:hypothetical protein